MIIINYDVFTLYIPHHDHHYDDHLASPILVRQESDELINELL